MPIPLINTTDLATLLQDQTKRTVICDCRFDLADPEAGLRHYSAGHMPGAVHIDLDRVLSRKAGPEQGRHPLPAREDFTAAMAAAGVSSDTWVVCYDACDSMYASRLWWMLRWIGHAKVLVLDGGLKAWMKSGGPLSTGEAEEHPAGTLTVGESLVDTIDYDQVVENLDSRTAQVIDARSPERFRGEGETIDPVGGHIPGAVNRFFKDNLQPDGCFKSAPTLRQEFLAYLDGQEPAKVISQCGSGVTACHNLLAMEIAGLHGAALYPGSWSQWCNTAGSPISR
ncbi:sulfurtransferase [Pusillimonas sp. MFBS29]|uniref:sulfurtransferase n=1 Tax=Pusillimonas sp. MFBS29 TaxID=2886690 RepID=UPI001D10F0A9|nr:sulfurtransferase [Pusillimonas sp. MFBS29]MCC2595878.1 sulfurtransferase [Pusillimonas sp. MFBS29]